MTQKFWLVNPNGAKTLCIIRRGKVCGASGGKTNKPLSYFVAMGCKVVPVK